MKSASFPILRLPVVPSMPSALAPFRVAMRSAMAAGTALASFATPFASSAASFISAIMSCVLFAEAPSVPSATFTPARMRSATRQKPLASFRPLEGQWTMFTPPSAHHRISSSVRWFMCTATSLLFTSPRRLRFASGVHLWSLRWQLFDSLSPLALSSHSAHVSCRWMWSGTSCFSLSAPPFASVSSEQVYGECSDTVQEMRFSAANCSFAFSPLARYSSGPPPYMEGKSMAIMPMAARIPDLATTSQTASGNQYMSLNVVTPPRIISTMASSAASRTNSGLTNLNSNGQIVPSSHSRSGMSSETPRR
mmetsp:Transcript_77752/g.204164  ORF Transcript_77752/g.204164 Transcript_77752/m.204164 type:complete len:308 (-) Transcript_77752:216-1139(-)